MELMTMALTIFLSIGLGLAGTRALLEAVFFFMARPIDRRADVLAVAPAFTYALSLRAPAARIRFSR